MGHAHSRRNRRESLTSRGHGRGGGDTGMHPNQLFYCGDYRQECRCGGCDGFCGPDNGCPCNACVELVNFKVNRLKHLCRKGTTENESVVAQDTTIKVTDLYYCGRMKNECYCGTCDGRCGPNNGCPCRDCLELLNVRVNQLGHFCKKGPTKMVAQHLNRPWSELYYCGRIKSQFRCGNCSGICSPINGCPCDDCFKLSELKMNRLGDVCHRGYSTKNAGHTGMICMDLFYCDKRKYQCHCGNCDGYCGPTTGCPCLDCLELVGLSVLPARFPIRICKRNSSVDAHLECPCGVCRNYEQQLRNSRGDIAIKGESEGSGGCTGVESKKLFYCGVVHNECGCGTCDGRCGPSDGCPCSSCIALYIKETSLPREKPSSVSSSNVQFCDESATHSIDSPTESHCVVCLDRQKTIVLVPCGHYAFCQICAHGITDCAVCRAPIEKRVKVFDS